MEFTSFKIKLKEYYNKLNIVKELPSDDFLFWLIGFTEGDGCFSVNNRNELSFILVQGTPNKILLDNILKQLNLGHIIKQNERVYRLIIQKNIEIDIIIELFNGNIVLPSKKIQFQRFYTVFFDKEKNKNFKKIYINNNNKPSINNTWLLGFVEAEGCFTISLLANSNAFRTRFIVSQKGDINIPILSELVLIFKCGFVSGHSNKDCYTFTVSGFKNIINIYLYFDKYLSCFQGIKKDSYLKFKELNFMLGEKKHLDPKIRKFMEIMATNINSAYRKFK